MTQEDYVASGLSGHYDPVTNEYYTSGDYSALLKKRGEAEQVIDKKQPSKTSAVVIDSKTITEN